MYTASSKIKNLGLYMISTPNGIERLMIGTQKRVARVTLSQGKEASYTKIETAKQIQDVQEYFESNNIIFVFEDCTSIRCTIQNGIPTFVWSTSWYPKFEGAENALLTSSNFNELVTKMEKDPRAKSYHNFYKKDKMVGLDIELEDAVASSSINY